MVVGFHRLVRMVPCLFVEHVRGVYAVFVCVSSFCILAMGVSYGVVSSIGRGAFLPFFLWFVYRSDSVGAYSSGRVVMFFRLLLLSTRQLSKSNGVRELAFLPSFFSYCNIFVVARFLVGLGLCRGCNVLGDGEEVGCTCGG